MDLDEPDLTDLRPGESPAAFESRLRMLRRTGPIVQRLTDHGFAVVVESGRRGGAHAADLESDFVVQYGDVRLRVLLCAGEVSPLDGSASPIRLAHYFLDVPDTDALAVVGDDTDLTTWVLDVYDANDLESAPNARPLPDAIAAYFNENVFAVELPDFRRVLALPTEAELRHRIERSLRTSFDRVRSGRVRIPEKIAALESLGPEDMRRLVALISGVLAGEVPATSALLGRDDGERS
jgi:hypothetical protein